MKNKTSVKEDDLGKMISFWVECNGFLDLDTDEKAIVSFYEDHHQDTGEVTQNAH